MSAGARAADSAVRANAGYHSHRSLNAALDSLARARSAVVQVKAIGESAGGREVRVVRLGAGADVDARPAVLLLANVHGPHVVGSEVAFRLARELAAGYGRDTAVTRLLDRATLYLIPRVNPDAAEAFFGAPLAERVRDDLRADDDRDGEVDEDGPDDLDGDGLIATMRVADPAGEWMADSADAALMRKAAGDKGEVGRWKLYPEGKDDDKDERWNEDPPGGTDVGVNFSFQYPYFGAAAGDYPMSAVEARAVAKFLVDHPNVALVYVLGPQDNLLASWEAKPSEQKPAAEDEDDDGPPAQPPLTSVLETDRPYLDELAKRFRRATGAEKGPASANLQGDPLSWAYYHMGRWALGSRVWWPAVAADTTAKSKDAGKGRGGRDDKDPIEEERGAFHWSQRHAPGSYLPWKEVRVAGLEGRRVEVGGWAPYARWNPPAAFLDSLARGQGTFVRELLRALPSISLREVEVERVSDRLFRVTAQVANDGYLPTLSGVGMKLGSPRKVRVQLDTKGQTIRGGRAVQLLGPIAGSGGSQELTWLIVGAPGSSVTLIASSPAAGTARRTVTLR